METKIENKQVRQPIITVCGHVDHGKTSLLDKIRGTSVAEKEAGGITQKISFTMMPKDIIEERAGKILDKFKIPLSIPGFLFIDTPGHAAFTNLRKRGGSLADIAILVIDINEGIRPQTAETIQILKANKTPFIIALNKIDNISGWQSGPLFLDNFNRQVLRIQDEFNEKVYTLMDALSNYGINAEIYTKISDFSKNVALVPCSARSGEGITEIIAMLCALSQKFLQQRISLKEQAKGVVLEIKKEKSINYAEVMLYDGELKLNDEIAIASFAGTIKAKVRSIQEALPLSKGYKATEKAIAASGLRIQTNAKDEILPGMPFQVIHNNLAEIEKEFDEELTENIQTQENGIIVKAESLGSLEALLYLLKDKQIPVVKATIGDITKKDAYQAMANPEQERVILGFNVSHEELGDEEKKGVKIFTNEIVYKLIEDFEAWRQEKQREIERKKLAALPALVKIQILPYVFRNSNPAVFGIKVEGGLLKQDIELINRIGAKIGRVKAIQEEKTNLQEAAKGKEVAISIPGVNFERELQKDELLYSNLSEFQFRAFKENKYLLTQEEIKVLQEIAAIKRAKQVTWGI